MIAVIDYGMGNLRSVEKALEKCGAQVNVTASSQDVLGADKVVFPGVGALPKCIERLKSLKLIDAVRQAADAKPFLGICLGLQALFSFGYEGGYSEGLGVIKGEVIRFPEGIKVPHMGWNNVNFKKECPIFKGIEEDSYFYFDHSYYVVPDESEVSAGLTDYSGMFVSAVWHKNIFGVQFHPEKSQEVGLKVLKNFIEY